MKKVLSFLFNAALSVALGIAAVYVISFLNIVPHSMQVDLPHYMYPDIMPASGTTAYDAEKARERLGKKVHEQLVEVGIATPDPTPTPLVLTREDKASGSLRPYSYPTFAKPLGCSLVQQGYFTMDASGEADGYFSPGPDGSWYRYDPKTGLASEDSGEAAWIPCPCEDLITFAVTRDPAGTVFSDVEEILAESGPVDDLGKLAKKAAGCFGHGTLTGVEFASLLQYRASGLFLGFADKTRSSNLGKAFYLSGEDRRTITQVVYNTKYTEYFTESAQVSGDVISAALDGAFYVYDPETRMVKQISFWSDDTAKGLRETNVGALPEGYTGPPVVGDAAGTLCCVFAGSSSVQMMDLGSGEIRALPQLALTGGETFSGVSFVFGTDRLVLFYTTNNDPAAVRVSEVLYDSLEG